MNKSTPAFTVTVTGYGSEGDGIARLDDGRVVFIRNGARGDTLEIALTKEQARSARAEIVRILAPSPHRIEQDCPAYPQCGGCDFRHITYEEELDAKLNRVNDALQRIGGISARADEILRTGQTDGYRNKAMLHADGRVLGFYQARSHAIVPITRCALLKDDLNSAIPNLTPDGDITLRSGRNGSSPPLEEELDGLVFGISDFFQVNTGAALLLYQKARAYAALSKHETLVDLYCGVGAASLFVGRDAGYVLGVEINPNAVEAARKNARRNSLSHVEFLCADAANWEAGVAGAVSSVIRAADAASWENSVTGAASWEACASKPDCVIADPPRKGLSSGAIQKILALSPKRIVYISCDPATLARDLRALEGFTVQDVCAVDMFPRTANVETVALLSKLKSNTSIEVKIDLDEMDLTKTESKAT